MNRLARLLYSLSHGFGKLVNAIFLFRAYIKCTVYRGRDVYGVGDNRGYVRDMGKRPLLSPVSKDGHGFFMEKLVHENPYDVTVGIGYILLLSIDIMRTENN